MAQLHLLPPRWEDREGEGKKEESYLPPLLHKLSGIIVRAVMKLRVRLRVPLEKNASEEKVF